MSADDWLAESPGDSPGSRSLADAVDHDLLMAQRDRERFEEAIRGQAALHALEEIAGELYLAVYRAEMAETLADRANHWGLGPDAMAAAEIL